MCHRIRRLLGAGFPPTRVPTHPPASQPTHFISVTGWCLVTKSPIHLLVFSFLGHQLFRYL